MAVDFGSLEMYIRNWLWLTGSFNFTGPANRLNDENVLVIGDKSDPDITVREKQKQLGAYVLDEIDRIVDTYCEQVMDD